MKKFIIIILSIITMANITAFAAEIPIETYPENATEESAAITENLIGGILDEVQNGLGYQMASARANTIIRKAVIDKQTNGYGYGILSPIAQNAIRYYRDVYLCPDYYTKAENTVRVLISDLIIEVENGADYETVKEKAYTKIYQSVNPSYNPTADRTGDFCYWNIPSADSIMLMQGIRSIISAINT